MSLPVVVKVNLEIGLISEYICHEPGDLMSLQSYRELCSTDLTQMVRKIPSDVHMHWYTSAGGVSILSKSAVVSAFDRS